MMKIEIYTATRPQDSRKVNEDAFLIERDKIPFAALCDGAGRAEQSARRVLAFFQKLFQEATRDDIERFVTWARWIKLLDSSLLGGNQSTFIAIVALEGRCLGTCVGDSRAYLKNREGHIRILTEGTSKYRLGSGMATPFPLHFPSHHGDLILLMSDGAWTPLNMSRLKKILAGAMLSHLSDLPPTLLEEAGRAGRADDMTVIAMRIP